MFIIKTSSDGNVYRLQCQLEVRRPQLTRPVWLTATNAIRLIIMLRNIIIALMLFVGAVLQLLAMFGYHPFS